jgi:hypothetical protein
MISSYWKEAHSLASELTAHGWMEVKQPVHTNTRWINNKHFYLQGSNKLHCVRKIISEKTVSILNYRLRRGMNPAPETLQTSVIATWPM